MVVIVATADGHANSCVGLCPAESVELDGGGHYKPSPEQQWLWECWCDFWDRVAALKKRLQRERKRKVRVYHVVCGDGVDGNTHSHHGLVTVNKATIVRLGAQIEKPALKVADRLFWCRGTAAHVGQQAELEELIAHLSDATEDPKTHLRTRYVWRIRAGGVLGMVRHRPISTSTREHTRGGGAMRTAAQIVMECARLKREIPDFACFGHHHSEDSGSNFPVRVKFLPPWKPPGSYDKDRMLSAEPVGAGGRVRRWRGDIPP